jgi:PKD repeat protein
MTKLLFASFFLFAAFSINAQTTAEFSANQIRFCEDQTVLFTDNSSGNIVSWFWDFGNGNTSSIQNPEVTFQLDPPNSSQQFTISLTVTDDNGFSDTRTRIDYITVNAFEASFSLNPDIGCTTPHQVFFTDQSEFPDTWFWDFGDGNSSTNQNPVHSYTTTGDFTVTLTITDTIRGCQESFQDMVSVSDLAAAFTGNTLFGCGPMTVGFVNQSTGNISDNLWDFGDGSTSTELNPSHVYNQPGIYTVSLEVMSTNGCSNTQIRNNYIQVIGPDVNFGADTLVGIEELLVSFTDSTVFAAPITSWLWDFGDGSTSNLQNPTHMYSEVGSFDVSLTVSDIDGCTRTFTLPSYITITTAPIMVPTMGTWGIIVLTLMLLIFALNFMKSDSKQLKMGNRTQKSS